MNYYYCETCSEMLDSDDIVNEWRVSRAGAWGCGNPLCDSCYTDRAIPLALCVGCGSIVEVIEDDDIDSSIFDYVKQDDLAHMLSSGLL